MITWRDILHQLQECTEEQLNQPASVVRGSSSWDTVYEGLPVVSLDTVANLEFLYYRSVIDNTKRGDDLVLFVDGGPFGLEGAHSYEWNIDAEDEASEFVPIFNDKWPYREEADWTGPAQKLIKIDEVEDDDFSEHELAIIRSRVDQIEKGN